MASQSKSRGKHFDVFLSFRGKDTRYGFTDCLYHSLVDAGVETYRDKNKIRMGEKLGPQLLKAIEESKIFIPIFSKNYAESKWCLRELAKMVQCEVSGRGYHFFPIFYDVRLWEIKHNKTGSYAKAMIKHAKDRKVKSRELSKWKKALAAVGGSNAFKGLDLVEETCRYEGALIKIVVKMVLSELKRNDVHLPDTLVGMDNHREKLKKLLKHDTNVVRVIGILGMSGIGKTTIAKAMYNEVNEFFQSHCFLEDVGGKSKDDNGLISLQKALVSGILSNESPIINKVDEGIERIKEAIRGKKVFIVLDNVDHKYKIEKLAINHKGCGAGSLIVVTTTNEEVLQVCKVTSIYRPKLMGDSDALNLFCKHAFQRDIPRKDFHSLAEKVVSNARGLPLVLVVIGSQLSVEQDKGSWEMTSNKLMAIPRSEVLERLRIGYNALEYQQKQMFLDIACFFSGVDKESPFYMWEDCNFFPSEGIKALIQRSLIEVREDGKILWMHDQLIKLGRKIVMEDLADPEKKMDICLKDPWERTRLWDHEEGLDTLRMHPGPHNVEALCLDFPDPMDMTNWMRSNHPRLAGEDFVQLPKLRYLRVAFTDLVGDFKGLHSKLRWLEWRGCLDSSRPINLYLKNLVILDLSESRIYDDWKWWVEIKTAVKLKVLNLSSCSHLARVPPLSCFASLEILNINWCWSLRRLDGLEQLVSLTYLSMSYCYALERLPDLSKLGKLKVLNLSDCEKLIAIEGLKKLSSLEVLLMDRCISLETLPNLANLQKLSTFSAPHCKALNEIQGLGELEHFDMSCCWSLNKLADLSNLKKLTKLETQGWKVTEVPGLGELESLEHLIVKENECLERLPDLSKLVKLKELEISSCERLMEIQGLQGLESLELFNMSNCSSLERVTNLSNLKNLKEFNIEDCERLYEISDLNGMETLEILRIEECRALEKIPDLSSLQKLKELTIDSFHMIVEIQGLERLKSLEKLSITDCGSIETLPELPNFGMLQDIELSNCKRIYQIESLTAVVSLERLCLSSCEALGEILDLGYLKKLKKLYICWLRELTKIRGLEELESLKVLNIQECESIENLPDLSSHTNLIDLVTSCCVKLTEISGLEELKSLEMLDVRGCPSLQNLPDLSNLKKLQDIAASCCVKLTEIRGLEELESLESLNFRGCVSMKNISDLSNLNNLKYVDFSDCVELTEIHGLEELKSLTVLHIRNCKSLKDVPDLPKARIY